MKLFLTDQSKHFKKHFDVLSRAEVMHYEKQKLKEEVSVIEISTAKNIDQLNIEPLLDYHIFPEHIMSCFCQWKFKNRTMRPGDTIVQQVYLPPIKSFSQKIIFGVRIKEVINEPHKKGFSYETLQGHVEKGISTFTVEKENGKCFFKIHTFSGGGNILTKLLGPVFSKPYQAYCTKAALTNVKNLLEAIK